VLTVLEILLANSLRVCDLRGKDTSAPSPAEPTVFCHSHIVGYSGTDASPRSQKRSLGHPAERTRRRAQKSHASSAWPFC
jgi:hypothetical protein